MYRATTDGFNARQRHSGRGLGASRPADAEPDPEVVALRRARALRDGLADVEREHGNLSQIYIDALVRYVEAAERAMQLGGDEPFGSPLIEEETALFEDGVSRMQALAPRLLRGAQIPGAAHFAQILTMGDKKDFCPNAKFARQNHFV